MTRPGIEPRSPGPLANTLTARPMSGNLLITGHVLILGHNLPRILVATARQVVFTSN